MKKTHQTAFVTVLMSIATSGLASAASLATINNIPTNDLIHSVGNEAPSGGGSNQQTFAYRPGETAGTRGRGQSFAMNAGTGSTYDISSISLALGTSSGNGTRGEGDLTFTVFEFIGSGATASAQVEDFANWNAGTGGASGTQLFSGVFDIAASSTFSSSDLLQISFANGELQLDDDKAYGFFLQYKLDDVTGLSGDVSIGFDADVNGTGDPFGALLNTDDSGQNGSSDTRDLNYFITGTEVVPEPSSTALLGLGGLALLLRRRK